MKKCRVLDIPLEISSLEMENYNLESRYSKSDEVEYDFNIIWAGWGISAIHPNLPAQNIYCKLELSNKINGESQLYDFVFAIHNCIEDTAIEIDDLRNSIMPTKIILDQISITSSIDETKLITANARATLFFS